MATGLVFVTVKQGSKQLKARGDCDLRPAESFDGLVIGRDIEEIPVDADIRVTMHPDARELSVLSASIRDLNSMIASRAMINPYVVVHITQPEPQPKSAAALEADAKAAAARAGSLLRSASTSTKKTRRWKIAESRPHLQRTWPLQRTRTRGVVVIVLADRPRSNLREVLSLGSSCGAG